MRRPAGASRRPRAALLSCLVLAGPALAAGPDTEAELPPIVVSAPPQGDQSASALDIGADQLATRPLQRNGDLLEAAPGLVATQHSGEGKANQYFLRGFNLDHGTDLAIQVDGMPVNMRTHAHGQGYADIGFVIPELVAGMNVRKGPYFADDHDFANAGALRRAPMNRSLFLLGRRPPACRSAGAVTNFDLRSRRCCHRLLTSILGLVVLCRYGFDLRSRRLASILGLVA